MLFWSLQEESCICRNWAGDTCLQGKGNLYMRSSFTVMKKVRTKQKIYFFCNVVNHYQWYTQMLYTVCPSRHPSNRQGFRKRVMWYWLRCSVWVLSLDFSWCYCNSHHYIPVLTLPSLNWCNCSFLSRRKMSKVCFAVLFSLYRMVLPMYVWNHLTQYMLNYSMLENFLEISLHFFCKGIAYGM